MSRAAAIRYAEALFELAQDKDLVEPIAESLLSLQGKLSGDAGLSAQFFDAKASAAAKRKIVDSQLAEGLHPMVKNLLGLLIERQRESGLWELMLAFFQQKEAADGLLRMTVETAEALSEEEAKALTQKLATATGKAVVLTTKVAPEVIGGMRLIVGSTLIDGTIKKRFERLGDQLRAAI